VPITLPDLDPRRDATGVPAQAPIGGLAGTL
jgi:hypothetical protein